MKHGKDETVMTSPDVWYMRRLFEVYGAGDFLPQAAADLKQIRKSPALWRQPAAKTEGGDAPIEILPQLVAEIPWGHHRLILDKLSDPAARLYYLRATARFGWTRNVLLNPIGVTVYQLQSQLPADLKGKLPTVKQLADVVRAVLPQRSLP